MRIANGQTLLMDRVSILSLWSKNFPAVFSANCTVQIAIFCISQQPVETEADELLTIRGTTKAIEQLKNGAMHLIKP